MTHRETREDVARDPLTALLKPIFMGSDFYHVAKQCGDWLLSHEHAVAPSFHLVTEGQCRLAWHDGGEEHLQAGDLAFFPGDTPHQLTPQGVPADTPTQVVTLRSSRPGVGLICGHFRFVHDVPPAWFGALPRIVRIPRQARGQTFQHAVEAFAQELSNGNAPGHAPVTNALANALLILMLRHCLETQLLDHRHLMAFLDAPISRALKLLHEDPRRDWTLHELARAVGLSRSSFSERFHRVVGMTVVRYQGRLRMILADQALANGESIVGAMLASGYRSESTFRKAYKRIRGEPPSRLKTHATE
ncbi:MULTISPECIES: AraC family transcriptional regulator [Halomonadaceae]|uniref:AraC family transcriptional regulator n=1 Tax=Modicisalibacter zincidurans TaxID=1178777 RepID=A0ABP9RKX7_9GAMM|nr:MULTISPECIES: AraC family transcriptional regulator [Halomonas]MCD6007073.1 AraC family transcriptional regulator [Halomonas sp. IOP_31]